MNRLLPLILLAYLWVPEIHAEKNAHLVSGTTHIGQLTIKGNEAISTSRLKKWIQSQPETAWRFWRAKPIFSQARLDDDLKQLKQYYQQWGYFDTEIKAAIENRDGHVHIYITIVENKPVTIGSVSITGIHNKNALRLATQAADLHPGSTLTHKDYQDAESRIALFLKNQGYPWNTVKRRAVVNTTTKQARISYDVILNAQATFHKVLITGNTSIPTRLLQHYIHLPRTSPYNQEAVDKQIQSFTRLGYFDVVNATPRPSPDNHTRADVTFDVTEKKPRRLSASIGYDTVQGGRTSVGWRHLNAFGAGEKIMSQASITQKGHLFNVSLLKPRILTQLDAGIDISRYLQEEDSFENTTTQVQPHVTMFPRLNHQLKLGWTWERWRLEDVDQILSRQLNLRRDHSAMHGPMIAYSTTMALPLRRPTRYKADLTYQTYTYPSSSKPHFYTLSLHQGLTHSWKKFTITKSLNLGFIEHRMNRDAMPLHKRLYAGGDESVRGYERWHLGPLVGGNPLGGLSRANGSIEFKYPVYKSYAGIVFWDYGQVQEQAYTLTLHDFLFSYGLGVAYDSAVGSIALTVGFPVDPPVMDSPWQAHLAIQKAF